MVVEMTSYSPMIFVCKREKERKKERESFGILSSLEEVVGEKRGERERERELWYVLEFG